MKRERLELPIWGWQIACRNCRDALCREVAYRNGGRIERTGKCIYGGPFLGYQRHIQGDAFGPVTTYEEAARG